METLCTSSAINVPGSINAWCAECTHVRLLWMRASNHAAVHWLQVRAELLTDNPQPAVNTVCPCLRCWSAGHVSRLKIMAPARAVRVHFSCAHAVSALGSASAEMKGALRMQACTLLLQSLPQNRLEKP